MSKSSKTKAELMTEISGLKQKIKRLEGSEATHWPGESQMKAALEDLRKSEEKYKGLTENINLGIYRNTVGPEGKFIEANPAIIAMFGYKSKREFLAINVSGLYQNPEDRKKFNEKMLKEGVVKAEELWLKRKDGSFFVGSVFAVAVKDEQGQVKYYDGIIDNIDNRKRAESQVKAAFAALRESEERFRTVYENSTLGIYRTTPDGRVLLANPALARMLGYSSFDDLAARDLKKNGFEPSYPRSRFVEMIEKEGEVKGLESAWKRKDGVTIFVRESAIAVRDAQGKILYYDGTVEDITERKLAEKEKEQVISLQKATIESTADGILVIDQSGKITDFNLRFAQLWRIPDAVLATRDDAQALNFVLEQLLDPQGFMAKVQELYATPDQESFDVLQFKDGRCFERYSRPQLISGLPVGRVWSFRDVSERQQAAAEMESLALFPAENPNPILRVNRDGNLMYTNQAGMMLLPDWHLVVGGPVPHVLRLAVAEALSGPTKELEENVQGGRIMSFFVVPVMQKGYANIYGRDVTERRQAEAENRILEERLQWAEKMKAIGTLAGGIAHDFNNLLMGIQGYASMALTNLDPSHPNYERLKRIEEQVQSGADLTRQLLGFARGGRYEVKPTDMNDIVEKTSLMFGRTKKEITIYRKHGKDLWSVEVDQGQMEQVFVNLYVNAWQAMPGGGEIHLETENVILNNEKALPYSVKPGNYVKITVTDNGSGMDEKTRLRVFDPFFTTKEMGRGIGLGLASVYGIIKGHQGMINVYSDPGHGTTFTIYLPASDKEALKDEKATGEIARGTETILLVEDEKMVLDINKEMLESLGYRIYAAGSGQEGIAIFKEKRNEIDLVILDMIMPGLAGGETFSRLREIDPGVRVLLSSGYSLNGEAQHIMDRGCNGFLQKPYQIEILSRKIREIVGEKIKDI
jgi:two-component system cell cycle sensor histidine kinase/response regulator CckA